MVVALLLLLVAGGMNGSFAVPMKLVRGWEWERTWLAWSFLAMLVLPVSVAIATIPDIGAVYSNAGSFPLVLTAFFGMLWGTGVVFLGLGIVRVGVALSFGIVLGSSSFFGAIIPLLAFHRDRLMTSANLLTGIAILVAGVAACSWAGRLRELGQSQTGSGSFAAGLMICILSGLGSACMSLALNAAEPIAKAAEVVGVSRAASLNAVWPILLGGGLVVNTVYCLFQLIRHRNRPRFKGTMGMNTALVVAMAVLWSGSNYVFGVGARAMGTLGLVLGWPVFMAAIVLTANAWGLLSGEWHAAGKRAIAWEAVGCLFLMIGISMITFGGTN